MTVCPWLPARLRVAWCTTKPPEEGPSAWPLPSVAPTVMQFLAVAGDVTVCAPASLTLPLSPSLPAAKTGRKSCKHKPVCQMTTG